MLTAHLPVKKTSYRKLPIKIPPSGEQYYSIQKHKVRIFLLHSLWNKAKLPDTPRSLPLLMPFFRLVCIINHICRFFSSPFYYIELLAFQCNKSQSPALLWNFITPFNVFPHHVIFLPLDQCIFQSVASHSMYTSRIFFSLSRKFSSINDRGSHRDYSPVVSDHPSRSTTNNCLYQRLLNFN